MERLATSPTVETLVPVLAAARLTSGQLSSESVLGEAAGTTPRGARSVPPLPTGTGLSPPAPASAPGSRRASAASPLTADAFRTEHVVDAVREAQDEAPNASNASTVTAERAPA